MAWTYLVECSDGSLYVGSTTDLQARIAQHDSGGGAVYTHSRHPVTLLWAAEFESIPEAYAWERRMHGWSRSKKLALAGGEFALLPALSSRSYAGQAARQLAQQADRRTPRTLRDGPWRTS